MQYAEQKPMDNNTTNHFQKQYKVVGSSCVQHMYLHFLLIQSPRYIFIKTVHSSFLFII